MCCEPVAIYVRVQLEGFASMDMLSLAPIVVSLHPLSLPHLHLAFPLPTMLFLFQITVFVTLASTVLANSHSNPAQTPHHILLPPYQRNLPLPACESAPCVCDNIRTHNCYSRLCRLTR